MTPVFGTQITPERWQYEHSFSPWAWNDKRSIRLLNDRRYSCYMLPFFTLSENELASLLCNIQKKGKYHAKEHRRHRSPNCRPEGTEKTAASANRPEKA